MYMKVVMLVAFALITACSGNTKGDALALSANERYNEASTLVGKARSYQLKITDAANELALAASLMTNQNYSASIKSSEAAGKLASDAITKFQKKQAS